MNKLMWNFCGFPTSLNLSVVLAYASALWTVSLGYSAEFIENPPPDCLISGPTNVCPGTVNTHADTAGANPDLYYGWDFAQNSAGASFVGTTNNSTARVFSGKNSSYTLRLRKTDSEGGLQGECAYLVMLQDGEAPMLFCEGTVIASENPRNSGSATVSYSAPAAYDNCDQNPAVQCMPPSGSSFSIGVTTVTCTAMDAAGNSSSCAFEVKVVPFIIYVTNTNDSGKGTLREALREANATPGLNLVRFNIEGAPPFTIRPLTALPSIYEPVRIEGLPPGSSNSVPPIVVDGTLVEFEGEGEGDFAASGASDGFVFWSGSNVLRGLVINNFYNGVRLEGPGHNLIEGNWIGTDASGNNPAANVWSAVAVRSPHNVIGGLTAEAANVLSGNGGHGVEVEGAEAHSNRIVGNKMGLGADLWPLGNSGSGVRFAGGASDNVVGGVEDGARNLISHNSGIGVVVDSSGGTGNAIRRNSIVHNATLDIDIGDDGSTPNDPGDVDGGPNNYQNFPVIAAVRSDTESYTRVEGTFSGAALATVDLEFFAYATGDNGGFNPLQRYLGTTRMTTGEGGDAPFNAQFATPSFGYESVVATATDAGGNTSEFSPPQPVHVDAPPVVGGPSGMTNVVIGRSVTFCAEVSGDGPFEFQWRRNGVNILHETNQCLVLENVQLPDGGTYTVAAANEIGAVLSDGIVLLLNLRHKQGSDSFDNRTTINGPVGVFAASNTLATVDPNEPLHALKEGGRSIWYTWVPSATGIATIETVGSTFDTLLAIYTGENLGTLVEVASDEDNGQYLTSSARFNAIRGRQYQIAVDGFGGAGGEFVVKWNFQATHFLLPNIIQHPQSLTVAPGSSATFAVDAIRGCKNGNHDCRKTHPGNDNGDNDEVQSASVNRDRDNDDDHDDDDGDGGFAGGLSYQWFFNGEPITGATSRTFMVASVQDAQLGDYFVRVARHGSFVDSRPASLQINVTGDEVQNVLAMNKTLDAGRGAPIVLGGFTSFAAAPPPATEAPRLALAAAATVVRGYTGTQIFNTSAGGTEPNDQPICGVIGGASIWVTFVPQDTGRLFLNTDGSSYNTVLGVFVRLASNPAILQLVDCDNNSGPDGKDSALDLPVQAGRTNFVMIDGVNAATGVLHLNYSLVTRATLFSMPTTPLGEAQVRVAGHPAMRFTLESSSDMINWTPVLTTTATSGIFDFIDLTAPSQPNRLYRALMLP